MRNFISKNVKNLKIFYYVYSVVYFIYMICELIYRCSNNYSTGSIIYFLLCNLFYIAFLMVGIFGIVNGKSKVYNLVIKVILIYHLFNWYLSCFSGILYFNSRVTFIIIYYVIFLIASLFIALCAVLWFVNYFKKDDCLLDISNISAVIYLGFLLILFILSFVLTIKYNYTWVNFIEIILEMLLVIIFVLTTNKKNSLSE